MIPCDFPSAAPLRRHFSRRCVFLLANSLAALLLVLNVSGCGGGKKAAANAVSGIVTMGKSPVSGATVTFIGADGKKASGFTNMEGKYTIEDPPKGSVKITLTSLGGGGGAGPVMPPPPKDSPAPPSNTMASIPAKYAKPDNGLSFEVKGGKETYNIEIP